MIDSTKEGEMRKKIAALIVTLVCIVALLVTSCAPKEAAPTGRGGVTKPKSVTIVAFVDMTGPVRAMSYLGHVGYVTYWRWLNEEKGGIDGVPINIVEFDTAYDVKRMRVGYEQYKKEMLTCSAQGQSPFFDTFKEDLVRDKIPAFAVIGGSDAYLYPPTGWIYGCLNMADNFAAYADWVLKNWKESRKPRVALLLGDYPGGRMPLFSPPYLQYKGLEVVATELLPYRGLTSAADQLLRITKAKPDYIFTTVIASQLIICLKELRGMGIKLGPKAKGGDLEFIYSYGFDEELMAAMVPEDWDGLVVNSYMYDYRFYGKPGHEFLTLMIDKYRQYYNVPKDKFPSSIAGFVWGMVMAEAIKKAAEKVGWDKINSEAVGLYGYPNIKNLKSGGLAPPITLSKEDPRVQAGYLFRVYKDRSVEILMEYTKQDWVFKWLDEHGYPIK